MTVDWNQSQWLNSDRRGKYIYTNNVCTVTVYIHEYMTGPGTSYTPTRSFWLYHSLYHSRYDSKYWKEVHRLQALLCSTREPRLSITTKIDAKYHLDGINFKLELCRFLLLTWTSLILSPSLDDAPTTRSKAEVFKYNNSVTIIARKIQNYKAA
jgi:hypothetical protein